MPQVNQIVPKFSFPYAETVINDNTLVDNSTDTSNVDPTVKYVFAFMSGKGEDNKFIRKRSLDSFRNTFGDSNYKKYGQPLMMPLAILSNTNTSVWCMRVMPENACYANNMIALAYKADEENAYPDNPSKRKFRIKFLQKNAENISKKEEMEKAFKELTFTDVEGYKPLPFMRLRSNGRGEYGNNYTVKVSQNTNYEKEFGIKMYNFDILSIEAGLTKTANYVGAFTSSTKYQTATLVNDILADTDAGVAPVETYIDEDKVEDVYDAYITFCKEQHVLLEAEYDKKVADYNIPDGMLDGSVDVTEEWAEKVTELQKIQEMIDATESDQLPDLDCFDPLLGLKVASTEMLPFISYTQPISEADQDDPDYDANDYTSTDAAELADFGTAKGIIMSNGNDGDFGKDVDEDTKNAAIEKCYNSAFDGTYDRRILTARRIHVNALWDANYPYSVKKTLANLAILRNDALCYLDTGIAYTRYSEPVLEGLIHDYSIFDTYTVSVNLQHYTVRENTTGKRVKVSITYFLAQQYAYHVNAVGIEYPFVKSRCQLSGHVRDSLEPTIEDYENELKEKLYDNRFNYFETLDENVFQRATQSTTQKAETDLIEESNATLLYTIKSTIETDVQQNLYNFADASVRATFTNTEKAKFATWVGSKIVSIDIEFKANAWESEHSIVHCYLAVVFRGLEKRAIIEIDINKRNSTSSDSSSSDDDN